MTALDFHALLGVKMPPGPKHGCKQNRGMRVMLKKRIGAHDWWAQPARHRQDDKQFLKLARRDPMAAKQYLGKVMGDSIRDRLDEAGFARSVMPVRSLKELIEVDSMKDTSEVSKQGYTIAYEVDNQLSKAGDE